MTESKKIIIIKKLKVILLKNKNKSKKQNTIKLGPKWVAKKKKNCFLKAQLKKAKPKINLSKDSLWWRNNQGNTSAIDWT